MSEFWAAFKWMGIRAGLVTFDIWIVWLLVMKPSWMYLGK